MKKKYISPNMLVARLGITRPIAGSLKLDGNTGTATFNNTDAGVEDEVLGRDYVAKDYDIWDNAW